MKIKNTTSKKMTIRGTDFPKGKAVDVDDPALAAKVLGIPGFEEVKSRGKDED